MTLRERERAKKGEIDSVSQSGGALIGTNRHGVCYEKEYAPADRFGLN